ncbi:MAG: AraC family transcriptional regulator [Planctomycetota bacterium]
MTPSLLERFESRLPEVRSAGLSIFDPIWAEKMHTTSCAELLHVISGHVELVIGKDRFPAGPGDTLCVPSNTTHRDEFDFDLGLKVFMVHFSWDAEPDFTELVDNHILRRMSETAKAEIGNVFSHIRTDLIKDSMADTLVLRSRVLVILLMMLREAHRARAARHPEKSGEYGRRHRRQLMLRAKEYLEEHYAWPISLQDIASHLRVSPFYLSHVFSEESEFSLFAYLTRLRMSKARDLLAKGALNVSEVAQAVGYENANYFSKVFKRHFDRPPRDFLAQRK